MKKYIVLISIAAAVVVTSCSKKTPAYVNSIPDNAVAVASLNPMQLRDKGKLNSIASLKEKVKDEIWGQILEDPLSTGLSLNDDVFVFAMMEEAGPVIGVVSGMKDTEKFENTLEQIKEGIRDGFQETGAYTYIQPDDEGIISWNDEQMIVLTSPDNDELGTEFYTGKLDWMYSPVKEESITSLVNFKEFLGKMKDLNLWISSDDIREIINAVAPDNMEIDLPVELYNNYAQVFVDFANGEMDINGETFFSEEVAKNVEEFLVMNPSLNRDMLKLAPGGDLLMAVSGSMDLEKLQKLVSRFNPPQLDSLENRMESATGMQADQLLEAFTGDFAIAINGVEEEGMIPFEIFLGFGVNSDAIQDKLMASVESMAPVNQEGDFFIINVQGNEIYSGILNDMWVITNSKGYKEAVNAGSHQKSLINSKFNDFADGSVGMYLNLDLSSYPSLVHDLLSQSPERKHWVERITDPFDYMGFSSSNYKTRFILKTNTPSENSLYTLVKLADPAE